MSPSEQIPFGAPGSDPVAATPAGGTAVVYCEGQFGEQDGKTANGLVRHSERYEILSVIDSLRAGVDAGQLPRRRRRTASPCWRRCARRSPTPARCRTS